MDMPKSGGTTTVDSGAYTDLNRLSALKHGDKDSDANLKKVAQEFESLFVSQMLKAMRSANEVLAKDNPMNTAATRQYQDMYDQQLAVTMSTKGGGIGLQQVLMRQLSKNKDGQVAPPTAMRAAPRWLPVSLRNHCGLRVLPLPIRPTPVCRATTWLRSTPVAWHCRASLPIAC